MSFLGKMLQVGMRVKDNFSISSVLKDKIVTFKIDDTWRNTRSDVYEDDSKTSIREFELVYQ